MFKPLIKKVRGDSNNPTVLSENNSEEINENLSKDHRNSFDGESSVKLCTHRRSNSHAQPLRTSSISTEVDNREESLKSLSTGFSQYVEEPISIENYARVVKSWIDTKEEILQQKDEAAENLMQETIDLQNEMTILRSQLRDLQHLKDKNTTDNTSKLPYLQKQIDTLRSDNENLKSAIKSLRTQLNDAEAERDELLIKSTDICNLPPSNDLQKQLDKQKVENEQQKIELQRLREALIERDMIIEQQDKRLLVDHETQATQTDEDHSFVQVLAEPDVDTISKLQAELDDKNRTIKILQQRYNDLRKTLQREFHASIPKDLNQLGSSKTSNTGSPPSPKSLPLVHYDTSATSQSDVDVAKRASTTRQMTAVRKTVTFISNSPSSSSSTAGASDSSAILPHTTAESKSQRNGHRSSVDGQSTANGTNFKYLKHVLLKFMTSTEDEAIHLIRAVSTLLNFSADEERLLRETLDYKMSWFGKVSRTKILPSSVNY